MIHSRAIRQIFLLVTNYGLLTIVRFTAMTLVLRNLGPTDQDSFLYLYNLAMAMAILSDFGMRSRYFIDAGKNIESEFSQAFCYRVMAGVVTVLAFIAIVTTKDNVTPLAIFAFAIFAANTPPADISLQTLRGLKYPLLETWLRLVEGVLLIALIVTVAFSEPLIDRFALAWLTVTALRAIIAWGVLARVANLPPLRLEMAGMIEQVRKNFWSGLAQFTTVVLARAPVIVTPFFYPALAVREVAVMLMIVQLTQILSSAFSFYVMPRISDRENQALLFSWGMSVALCTGLAIFGIVFYFVVMTLLPTIEDLLSVKLSDELGAVMIVTAGVVPIIVLDLLRFAVSYVKKFRSFLAFNLVGLVIFMTLIRIGGPDLEAIAGAYLISLIVTVLLTSAMLFFDKRTPLR